MKALNRIEKNKAKMTVKNNTLNRLKMKLNKLEFDFDFEPTCGYEVRKKASIHSEINKLKKQIESSKRAIEHLEKKIKKDLNIIERGE